MLVSLNEAAAILGVSRDTVKRLVARGELRVVRIGGAVRIRRADVLELIERGGAQTKSAAGVGS